MDDSVVIAGGQGAIRGLNDNGNNTINRMINFKAIKSAH